MEHLETIASLSLAGLIVAVALFFAYRQLQTLRTLHAARQDSNLDPADRAYYRQRSLRRLFNSVLMLLLAGLIVGAPFLVEPSRPEEGAPLEKSMDYLRLLAGYWILVLLVFLGILGIAVIDFWATARFGFRQHKQLEQDRRAMLEEEAARLRQRRAEMN